MQFVLASASPARLAVLRAAGIDPVVRVSGIDEDAVAAELSDPTPEQLVVRLAQAKAAAVADELAAEGHTGESVIVGCDSMLSFDGEVVGKPQTKQIARDRWLRMAGKSGTLITGHAVVRLDGDVRVKEAAASKSTVVRWSRPSEEELAAYLESGEPLQVAGAFTLDGLGGWFVEGVDGDPSSVIGISLPLTRRLLAEVGIRVTDLWG
ncbi:Maf family protein [Thermocrispum municipale]|jgi:septum formation protein|uniref:Maf family protein n=1 Tax=Thermocrispum municipale TaxID=37926 RepID=UPI00041D8E49|nr:Maf family nucleotide pyrophosphatase [Thermocrispum municipale]